MSVFTLLIDVYFVNLTNYCKQENFPEFLLTECFVTHDIMRFAIESVHIFVNNLTESSNLCEL